MVRNHVSTAVSHLLLYLLMYFSPRFFFNHLTIVFLIHPLPSISVHIMK